MQHNGIDCGVFVLLMMESIVNETLEFMKLESAEIYEIGRVHILNRMVMTWPKKKKKDNDNL